MDKLIDFDETSSVYQVTAPVTSSKLFGVIKRKCFATEVTGIDTSHSLILKPGTLIQIISGYRGECCHFMMRDFANRRDKYKTTIYKCSKDDYISVKSELWPYLLALKNDECRIKLVQSVYSQEFDINSLSNGCQIKIRNPSGVSPQYFQFIVKHNGIVEKLGKGYYIGLQFMSGHDAITSEMKCMSRYYEFGGEGIVVPVDWIMLNLYKEEEPQSEPQKRVDEIAREVTEIIDWPSSVSIVIPKKSEEQGAISKTVRLSTHNSINDGSANEVTLQTDLTESSNENLNKTIGSSSTFKSNLDFRETPTGPSDHASTNYLAAIDLLSNSKAVKNYGSTKCELCSKKVELGQGVTLRECIHTFCMPCIRSHCERNIKCSSIRCPYKKEKECQVELLDLEIKELGGAEIYNTILNNRLKKYVESDSNAKQCLNKNCQYVWLSFADNHKNLERCPECNTSYCFVCNTAHEPGERHGTGAASEKSKGEGITGWIFNLLSKTPADTTHSHNKSHESNIPPKECTTLRDQKSMETNTPKLMCSCESRDSNCGVLLNCQHKMCRTVLKTIVQEQLKSHSQPVCPMCLQNIDDEVKKKLIGEKCVSCDLQADIRLTLCGHSFCQKCINDVITNQAIIRNKMTINCTFCDGIICSSDISKYGTEEVCALFKAKLESTKPIPKQNKHITLNDRTLLCAKCDQRIPTKQGVILANCRDGVCLKCCRYCIGIQLNNKQLPTCPVCGKSLEKFEEDEIMRKPVEASCNITSLVECLKCDEKFERRLIQKCLECENSICTSCAETRISGQIKNNITPNCPFCKKSFGEAQIATIMRSSGDISKYGTEEVCALFKAKLESTKPIPKQNKHITLNDRTLLCAKCDQRIPTKQGVILANCRDGVCLKCCRYCIGIQLNNKQLPTCPVCGKSLEKFEEDEIMRKPVEASCNITSLVECLKCDEKFERRLIQKCLECENSICTSCAETRISGQIKNNITPNCPFCKKSFGEAQIATIMRSSGDISKYGTEEVCALFKAKLESTKPIPKQNKHITLNDRTLLCAKCDQRIPTKQGVILANCRDGVCLKCCRYCIGIQLNNKQLPTCPVCGKSLEKFEEDEIMRKPVEASCNITSLVECLKCDEKFERRLIQKCLECENSICTSCAETRISGQIKNNITPNCPFCKKSFGEAQIATIMRSSGDISKYGTEEVCALFKAKLESTKPIPKQNKHITLNDRTLLCAKCDQRIPTKQGVILANCRDGVCLKCCRYCIGIQLNNKQLPTCPVCGKSLEKFEEDEIMRKPVEASCNITSLVECLKCDEKFERRLIQKCLECENSICTSCAETRISGQIKNNITPNCPFCKKSFGEAQIATIMRSSGELKLRDASPSTITGTLSLSLFECWVCDQLVEQLISLTKCAHEVCYRCLNQKILEQFNCSLTPRCPICLVLIDQTELNAIGILENLQRDTGHVLTRTQPMLASFDVKQVKSVSSHPEVTSFECLVSDEPFKTTSESNKDLCLNKDSFDCSYCEKHIDPDCGIVLTNCNHPICRKPVEASCNITSLVECLKCDEKFERRLIQKCLECENSICTSCAETRISGQIKNNITPNCPFCKKSFGEAQIATIMRSSGDISKYGTEEVCALFKAKLESTKPIPKQNKHITLNDRTLLCAKCDQRIPTKQGVILANCRDGVCLKCCRYCIGIQLNNKQLPTCPVCGKSLEKFEEDEIMRKPVEASCNITSLVECLKCDEKFERRLIQKCLECENSICTSCAETRISGQIKNNITPNCPFCKKSFGEAQIATIMRSSGDISKYGTEEVCALFKAKLESTKPIPKQNKHITLNDRTLLCAKCDQRIPTKQGVILANCRDGVCLKCCRYCIGIQLNNKQLPTCPVCGKSLEKFEEDEIMRKPVEASCNITSLVECLKCDEKFERRLIQKCLECENSICTSCAETRISGQIKNNITPNCPFCKKSFGEAQIATIMRSSGELKLRDASPSTITGTLSLSLFECWVCDQLVEQLISLTKCAHEVCYRCLNQKILEQFNCSLTPRCPICSVLIDQTELNAIGILENLQRDTGHVLTRTQPMLASFDVKQVKSVSSHPEVTSFECLVSDEPFKTTSESNKDLCLNKDSFDCSYCEKHIDPDCGIVLTNCNHPICRDCIADVIMQQTMSNIKPRCPLCQTLITNQELSMLDDKARHIDQGQFKPLEVSSRKLTPATCKTVAMQQNLTCLVSDEPFKTTSESNKDLCLNKDPFVCLYCEKDTDIECGIVLVGCNHSICLDCIPDVIMQQTMSNIKPRCPLCETLITNQELSMLDGKARHIDQGQFKPLEVSSRKLTSASSKTVAMQQNMKTNMPLQHNTELFDCAMCEKRIQFGGGIILAECKDPICGNCISMVVMTQLSNNIQPKCPICQTLITNEELSMLDGQARNIDQGQVQDLEVGQLSLILQHNEKPFECVICEESINSGCGIVLARCKHMTCRDCISDVILQQSSHSLAPKCRICNIPITDEEIRALGVELHNMYVENRIEHDSEAEMFVCNICKHSNMPHAIVIVTNCEHRFCQPCIAKALNEQSLTKKSPSCPHCDCEISGADLLKLGGSEMYKRFMCNKRKE